MPLITLPEAKYPLMDSEKKWLHKRKNIKGWAFCLHCPASKNGFPCPDWIRYFCPTDVGQDYKDAAKFEARVAAIMPYIIFRVVAEQAGQKDITIDAWTCLKLARLAVEEEMEAESAGR